MVKKMVASSWGLLNGWTNSRTLATTSYRCVRLPYGGGRNSKVPDVRAIGKIADKSEEPYEKRQHFIHYLYAYRGVIFSSSTCKLYTKEADAKAYRETTTPCYQVLVSSDDWDEMNFPPDMSCYLDSNGNREEKSVTYLNGMDVVLHDEIIPVTPKADPGGDESLEEGDKLPLMKHPLYSQLYKQKADAEEVDELSRLKQFSWFPPQVIFRQEANSLQVQLSIFYLGTTLVKGHNYHVWSYAFRIWNTGQSTITLRDSHLSVTSMTGESFAINGALFEHPFKILTPTKRVTQFGSQIKMPHPKGNNLWGKFLAVDSNGRTVEISIPTVSLEANNKVGTTEQTENIQ